MPQVDGRARWWLGTVMTIVVASGGVSANSQDVEDIVEEPRQQQRPTFGDRDFNLLVYGGTENAAQLGNRLESVLDKRIEIVDQGCKLSESQKKKLYLAGRGDIKRLLDRIEGKRARLHQVKHDPRQLNQLLRELAILRTALRSDIFGDNSLFTKILKTSLTAEQLIEYEKTEKEQWLIRHRHTVNVILGAESRRLKLSPKQTERLRALFEAEIRPVRSETSYDQSVGLYIMNSLARIPDDKIRPIFTSEQWKAYSQRAETFRSRLEIRANKNPDLDTLILRREFNGR